MRLSYRVAFLSFILRFPNYSERLHEDMDLSGAVADSAIPHSYGLGHGKTDLYLHEKRQTHGVDETHAIRHLSSSTNSQEGCEKSEYAPSRERLER